MRREGPQAAELHHLVMLRSGPFSRKMAYSHNGHGQNLYTCIFQISYVIHGPHLREVKLVFLEPGSCTSKIIPGHTSVQPRWKLSVSERGKT